MALCHVQKPCLIAMPCASSLCFFYTAKHSVLKFSFQILTRRGILFFFNSVVALRISSRLSPLRSRRFHFKEEALTASVRRPYATLMADTTCSGWRTGQHPIWPRPVCKRSATTWNSSRRWCELRKYKFEWRYDRRSGNCNLSNCKLTGKKKLIRHLEWTIGCMDFISSWGKKKILLVCWAHLCDIRDFKQVDGRF